MCYLLVAGGITKGTFSLSLISNRTELFSFPIKNSMQAVWSWNICTSISKQTPAL